jgi:hypothetical protein
MTDQTDQTDQQQDAGEQAWRVVELHGMTVATKGEPAPGVEMRNLQGMCELANAAARDVARLEARVRELEAEKELELGHAHEDWLHVQQDDYEALQARVRELEEVIRELREAY